MPDFLIAFIKFSTLLELLFSFFGFKYSLYFLKIVLLRRLLWYIFSEFFRRLELFYLCYLVRYWKFALLTDLDVG